MDQETYVNKVLKLQPDALFEAENCNLEEMLMLKKDIAENMFAKGWELSDAAKYIRCLEYASPHLDEEIALARMAKITAKYAPIQ